MNRIFNMDNGFFRTLSKLVDCIWLNFLFVLTCIPIFTIGASMTALYYTMQKVIRNDRGYVSSEYWHALKTNFKQATLTWLIVLAVGLLTYFDIKFMKTMDKAGHPLGKAYVFFQVLLALEILWCTYLFPYMSRFINGMKATMKNAALIAVLNLPWTLLILVLLVVAGLITFLIPIGIFFVPVLFTWVLNRILERVFRKYMTDEDKAQEDELNREYKN